MALGYRLCATSGGHLGISVAEFWTLVFARLVLASKALAAKGRRFGLDRDLQRVRSGSDVSSEC